MADKFLGVPYPILKDPKGYFRAQGGVDQIKSDLLILLLTFPSERVMLPEFGTDLRPLLFQPNDSTLAAQARQKIIDAITTWEPRISIQNINVINGVDSTFVSPGDDRTEDQHVLTIQISFVDPENITDIQELKLTVPLG